MHTLTRSLAAVLTAALSTLTNLALAAPIVQTGSTFDMRFLGDGIPATISLAPIVFDGLSQSFTTDVAGITRQISVTESQTDLGSGSFLISVVLTSDGNLFAASSAFASTGNSDPFDLLSSVRLDQALLTFGRVDDSDLVFDFTAIVGFPNPWNGSAPVSGLGVGFTGLGGTSDIRSIRFDLRVSQIPEPDALALAGLALAMLGVVRRRAVPVAARSLAA